MNSFPINNVTNASAVVDVSSEINSTIPNLESLTAIDKTTMPKLTEALKVTGDSGMPSKPGATNLDTSCSAVATSEQCQGVVSSPPSNQMSSSPLDHFDSSVGTPENPIDIDELEKFRGTTKHPIDIDSDCTVTLLNISKVPIESWKDRLFEIKGHAAKLLDVDFTLQTESMDKLWRGVKRKAENEDIEIVQRKEFVQKELEFVSKFVV